MFFQVNGLEISNLQKSVDNNTVVSVDIIANHLTKDQDNEIVLKEAFDADTVKEFLDIGIIEFWHETRNPHLSKEEKNKYLIGKPTAFKWENGKPVVTANLTKSHPLVIEMLPHLEAGQPVYAGSIGGGKMVLEAEDSMNQKHRIIPRIRWDHLAIAPINSVINREPGVNIKLLKKANDLILEFDDMQTFKTTGANYFANEEELRKALLAPASVSDMQETSGGVVTKQSLEKTVKNISFDEDDSLLLLDTMINIKNGKIPIHEKQYNNYFAMKGKKDFGKRSYRLFDKYFKFKKEQK